MITKTFIAAIAAGAGVAAMPSDWIPLVTVIGSILLSLATLFVTLATKHKTEVIAKAVDGAATLARTESQAQQNEIKRLSDILAALGLSGKSLTEKEAGYILDKPLASPVLPVGGSTAGEPKKL